MQRMQMPNNAISLATFYGIIIDYLRQKPEFYNMPFGEFAGTIAGNIIRNDYSIISDDNNQIIGFVSWIITTDENCKKWYSGQVISYEESLQKGNCLMLPIWVADNQEANNQIMKILRSLKEEHSLIKVYGKRYKQGKCRPMSLTLR